MWWYRIWLYRYCIIRIEFGKGSDVVKKEDFGLKYVVWFLFFCIYWYIVVFMFLWYLLWLDDWLIYLIVINLFVDF